tara:strand:- start:666 stop:803 length:138 start_codon:yes stop_codon:yes gene_type:complete
LQYTILINSLKKIKKAIEHSCLTIGSNYIRGLEVSELEEKDMPMV